MASHSGLSKTPSEMRIILLGYKTSGMSSSGNTILGSEQFSLERTGQCEKRQGDVGGRQVTVVNTPGWYYNASLKETSELIKQEIVLSASLCPPGPHALLLVIRADTSRTADRYKKMEEHVLLLSQTVWSHTMILFSFGDLLGGKSIEQHIKSEGEGLQRLVKLCGNRYHVFNNKNRGDDTQVTQLLDKIQEVAGEKGGCFEIDRRVLEETVKKRRTQDEGAARRQMKVKEQRESIRSMMGDDLHLSEMRIILLGHKGSGKSSSGNTILGSEQFSLERTDQCEKRQGDVGGRQVTVVNTPGWWKDDPLNETPEPIRQQIALSASLCPPGPDALLLVMRADISCTADEYKNMEDHMQLLSERVWSHTMILFTVGDSLGGKSIGQWIECEGEGLQRLVELCGNRYHVFNNRNRGDDTQVTELLLKIEEMDHYGTGRPATPDTKPKAVKNSPVPAESKAVAASVPAQSKGTASFVPAKPKAVKNSPVPAKPKGTALCVPELKKRQCEVLFDYVSQREDLLELKEGDIIDFIREDEAGWWFGSLNGKSGLFPSNFVKELEASGEETDTSLSLDVIKEKKKSQQKVNQDVQDQMQKMQSEVHEKINLRQTEAGMKRTSLSLDTLRNTKEIEDCKRRQHQLDQDQQELRNQHPVLVGRVKNLAAQFEESQRELVKIRQRQTEAEKKLTSLAQDVTQKATIKEQLQQQKVIQDLQDLTNKLTDQMQKMQCEMEKLGQRQTEADQKRASATQQHLTQMVEGAEDKLLSVRKEFVQRISDSILNELLDELLHKRVITREELDTANEKHPTQNKARHVIDMVLKKGNKASSLMIITIHRLDQNLQLSPSD